MKGSDHLLDHYEPLSGVFRCDQGWIQRRIFGGLRGPAGQNFGAAAAITTFLSEFRGKTGLKLIKRPAAGVFFENNLFSSNFQAFLVLPGGL